MKSDMTKLDRRMLEYGRAREWRQLNRIHKSESQLISAIQGTILDTITECEKEANLWLMTYARSDGISLSEAKKAVRLKDIRELEAKAKEYVKRREDLGFAFSEEAMKEMRRYNFGMKMNRLELLQHNLALALGMGTVDVEEIIGKHLTYATEEELRRQAGLLGLNIPDPDIMRINAEAIVNASFHEENFSQRIWKNKQELEETLDKGIKKSVMMGHNPVTWARSLKELLRDTENDAMYKMKRIAITESGRVQIAAQRISYETAGFSQYMVICEPTACPHCMKFDGEVFAIADLVQGENAPMFHPFCRCSTTPYMSREEVEAGFRELERDLLQKMPAPAKEENATSLLDGIEECKDFAELTKILEQKYGINVTPEVEELEFTLVKDALIGFERTVVKYPDVGQRVQEITTLDKGMMSCNGSRITFNPKYFDSQKEVLNALKNTEGTGWFPQNTSVSSIGAHETGHAVAYDLLTKDPTYLYSFQVELDWVQDITAKKIVSQACKEIKKTTYGKDKNNSELRESQSRYGATNAAEAIAEAYADNFANGVHANPLSTKIIEIIDSKFEEYGGANAGT